MQEGVPMMNQAIMLLICALLCQILNTNGMSLNANQQEHINKLQDLVKHDVPAPNNLMKIYETELDYGFKPISIIVLKGNIEPKTSIKFRELEVKNDKGFVFKFDSNLDKVIFGSELKYHKPKGTNTLQSTVTIQSHNQGLEICLNGNACRMASYGHGSINKIEISNFALTNVSYYTETPNDPAVDQYEMKCSKSACDIEKMKKKGKSFLFTRKLPTYKKRAHINLEESYKDIAFHMDIRQDQKEVVFNTRAKDKWNKPEHEEREKTFYFAKGNTYTIAFNVQTYGITVSVNGMFYHYYKHRMDPERVKKLWFSWDQEDGNYSFIGEDELGLSQPVRSNPINLPVQTTPNYPFMEDFEYINDQPLMDSDKLLLGSPGVSEFIKIELPKPNNDILSYKTDLICGFPKGSSVNIRGIVRNNSSIVMKSIGENFEIMFTFNLGSNMIQMYTRDARDEAEEKKKLRLKAEREMDFSFISGEDEIEVCADEQCVVFTVLSEMNHIDISNVFMTDINYEAKPVTKPQPVHHKMNCSEDSCDVSQLQKHGSVFTFVVKLPINESWYKVDFRESEKLVPFHMSVGTADRKTVIEAIDPEWDFSKEEIESLPLKSGQPHVFKFFIQPYGTLAAVDGYYFHFFRHRLEPDDITDIQYEWDLLDASYHNDGCYHKKPSDVSSEESYEDY